MFSDNLDKDEHVMCYRSKLINFLEQTELTNKISKEKNNLNFRLVCD